ncbi:hypothetical protein C1I92_23040, partial [Jiangella anatolica]
MAAGCGSGAEEPTTSFAASGSASEDAEAGGSRPGAFPGAAGMVAAIDGTTLQVQGMSGQVAVTYTDATAITAAVTGSAADVVAGVCVLVRSEDAGPESTEVVATSVAVSAPAADGSCGGGLGGALLGEVRAD